MILQVSRRRRSVWLWLAAAGFLGNRLHRFAGDAVEMHDYATRAAFYVQLLATCGIASPKSSAIAKAWPVRD